MHVANFHTLSTPAPQSSLGKKTLLGHQQPLELEQFDKFTWHDNHAGLRKLRQALYLRAHRSDWLRRTMELLRCALCSPSHIYKIS